MSPELLFCLVDISHVTKRTSISLCMSGTEAVASSFNTNKATFIHILVPKAKRNSYIYRFRDLLLDWCGEQSSACCLG